MAVDSYKVAGAILLAAFGFTVSAVGGYSPVRPRGAKAHRSSEFTTVGIVTQATGDVFWVSQDKKKSVRLAAGSGLMTGKLWVEGDSSLCFTSVDGVHYDVAGPAVLATTEGAKVHVLKGVVLVRALENGQEAMKLGHKAEIAKVTSPFAVAQINLGCEALIVALPELTQVAAWSVVGEPNAPCAAVSHFNLIEKAVPVASGEFTEVAPERLVLEADAPKKLNLKQVAKYLSARMDYELELPAAPKREIASEGEQELALQAPESHEVVKAAPSYRGTEKKTDLEEPKDEKAIALLAQKYAGSAEEDRKEREVAKASQAPVNGADRAVASKKARKQRVEILEKGNVLDKDHLDAIRKLQQL